MLTLVSKKIRIARMSKSLPYKLSCPPPSMKLWLTLTHLYQKVNFSTRNHVPFHLFRL